MRVLVCEKKEPSHIEMSNAESNTNLIENLTNELRDVRKLFADEQSATCELKQQLYESESKRLELISSSNREIFQLNADAARIRKDLEKSEALRQTLESELAALRSSLMKEKLASLEKDKSIQDLSKLSEGL